MDALPVKFYEDVTRLFIGNSASVCSNFPRNFGAVAAETFHSMAFQIILMIEGQIASNQLCAFYAALASNEDPAQFTEVKARHHRHTHIEISAETDEDYPNNPAALRELVASARSKNVALQLETSNLTKELEECILSFRIITNLMMKTAISAKILTILTKIVQKRTLNKLVFPPDHQFDAETTDLLLDLLKQEQFDRAEQQLPSNSLSVMRDVFADWTQNSPQMVGKRMWCRETMANVLAAELGFRECTAQEEAHIATLYPIAQGVAHFWIVGQSFKACVLENPNGNVVYWLFRDDESLYSVVMFY